MEMQRTSGYHLPSLEAREATDLVQALFSTGAEPTSTRVRRRCNYNLMPACRNRKYKTVGNGRLRSKLDMT
ncbi:hypothetical protein L249_8832, partial [Ophiocordyceps polyrhachis-furcata BCC 54312]